MSWLDSHARLLLVVHAIVGAATIAVTSHLALWAFGLLRGREGRAAGVTWFAAVGLGLYVVQFALGNLAYPLYKVRVRAEYLDLHVPSVVRLFDIKEHWAALGLPLIGAAFILSRRRSPAADRLLFACALGAAACAWLAGVVGLITTSYRSIAPL